MVMVSRPKKIFRRNTLLALGVALVVATLGYVLVLTKASGFFASVDASTAALGGNASLVTETDGSKSLRFNAPPVIPPSGDGNCALPKYPDASCTGVPTGTALTVVSGGMTINTDGTIVDGKDIHGCVVVNAKDVTIRNSKITCPSNQSNIAVLTEDHGYVGSRLLVEDSEVSCGNTNGTAFSEANLTARRLNVHGCENGFDVNQYMIIEDNYIHDLYDDAVAHTDGIQFATGHFINGNQLVSGASNVTITHNSILVHGTSAIITGRSGTDENVLIQSNLFAGGAFTLYCEQLGTKGINYRVINNHFSTMFYPKVGAYGPWTDCENEDVVTGNVYHESGLPVPF
jgi:hypothetical protein